MSSPEADRAIGLHRAGRLGQLAAALAQGIPADLPPATLAAAIEHLCDRADLTGAAALCHAAAAAGARVPLAERLARLLAARGGQDAAEALLTLHVPPPGAAAAADVALAMAWLGLDRAGRGLQVLAALAPPQRDAATVAYAEAQLHLHRGDAAAALAALDRGLARPDPPPLWAVRARRALAEGTIETCGLTLSVPAGAVSPGMIRVLARGGYERNEIDAVLRDLRPDDRVLELGSGLGVLAATVGQRHPGVPVLTIEANPALAPAIARNLATAGGRTQVLTGLAGLTDGEATLHVPADFWASSALPGATGTATTCPALDLRRIMAGFRPTVLVMDIEGGEADLLPVLDLSPLRRLIVEMHPDLFGTRRMGQLIRRILDQGLDLDRCYDGNAVFAFDRPCPPDPAP